MNTRILVLLSFAGSTLLACKKDKQETHTQLTVISNSGEINGDLEAFRTSIGAVNNSPGSTGGRREINWDAVAEPMIEKELPGNFFNQTQTGASVNNQRGLLYSQGTFMVSNRGFSGSTAGSTTFSAFSGTNVFANVASLKWEIGFQKAGTTQAASVRSFGAVFVDVDQYNSTSVEYFNGTRSLGKYFVPSQKTSSPFSFVGVHAPAGEQITKIIFTHSGIVSAGAKDISDGGTNDLVVLDDFIYSEPVAQ